MSLRLLHLSDLHGKFWPKKLAEQADLVLMTGDMFPNRTRGRRDIEPRFQTTWWNEHAGPLYREAIGDKRVLVVNGNHDFVDMAECLRRVGVDAVNLLGRRETIGGLSFCGFPHIPFSCNEWNYEVGEDEIALRLREAVGDGCDVLVTHCPPRGILDLDEDASLRPLTVLKHWGSSAIATFHSYGREGVSHPRHHFFGHVHREGGKRKEMEIFQAGDGEAGTGVKIKFYNGATKARLVTIE